MRRLTTGILSEKWVVRRFRHCANVIKCTYTKLHIIAYYTPRLYGVAYCCMLQTCTEYYCTENCSICNTVYYTPRLYGIAYCS